MDGQKNQRNASLEELLQAGKQAFGAGDRDAAHSFWRAAAVANPYDERVWMALLDVLTPEDDREVCLENIIAINPLNPDARRELRALKRERRQRTETLQQTVPAAPRPKRQPKVRAEQVQAPQVKAPPKPRPQKREQGVLARAILTGIAIGLFAVVLGIVVSIVVYGGVLPMAMAVP